MKRFVISTVLLFIMLFSCSITVYSIESEETLFNNKRDELFSVIDNETAEVLEDLGLTNTDFESIGRFSIGSIIEYFSDDFKENISFTIKHTIKIATVIFMMSLITMTSYKNDNELIEFISVCIILVVCFSEISKIINTLASVIALSSDFLLGYVPVFASLIAMSGNVATALSYNTLLLSVSEISSRILSSVSEKIIGAYFALVIGFSLNRNVNLSSFVSSFSKYTSVIIGFVSSLFVAFLTVKSVFSANIDTVSARGIRFILSSFIPVVGGAISDAYSTLIGSIGVVKGSVAIIAIAVSLIINLPVMFEGLCMCISYNFLSFTAQLLDSSRVSQVFKAVSAGIKFLLLIQLFMMFILIVSTAVMVNFKSTM